MNDTDESPIVLFDGVCNLCTHSVQFIIKRDPNKLFRFASLQSEEGQALLKTHGLSHDLSTIMLIQEGRAYDRSSAALRICRRLNRLWPMMFSFIIVPKVVRDLVYNWIARNRYKWFGKTAECMIPGPETADRFL